MRCSVTAASSRSQSEEGKGSTFTCHFPPRGSQPREPLQPSPANLALGARVRIADMRLTALRLAPHIRRRAATCLSHTRRKTSRQGIAGRVLTSTDPGAADVDWQTTERGSIVRNDRACDGCRRRADAQRRGGVRADQGRRHQGRGPVHPGADAGARRASQPARGGQRRAEDAELGAAGAGRPPRGRDGLPQVADQGTARRRRGRFERDHQGEGRRLGDQDQGPRRLPLPPREHLDGARGRWHPTAPASSTTRPTATAIASARASASTPRSPTT